MCICIKRKHVHLKRKLQDFEPFATVVWVCAPGSIDVVPCRFHLLESVESHRLIGDSFLIYIFGMLCYKTLSKFQVYIFCMKMFSIFEKQIMTLKYSRERLLCIQFFFSEFLIVYCIYDNCFMKVFFLSFIHSVRH